MSTAPDLTAWLKRRAAGKPLGFAFDQHPAHPPRDEPPAHGHVIAAAHNTRRARGSGGWSDTGAVPWYVPAGAEFDAEQAKGYYGGRDSVFAERDNPWAETSRVQHEVYQSEYDRSGPFLEEAEDWDLGPRRAPHRPIGCPFDPLDTYLIPTDDLQVMIDEAEATLDEDGEVIMGRKPAVVDDDGSVPKPKPKRKRGSKTGRKRKAKVRVVPTLVDLDTWPSPAPDPEPAEEPSPTADEAPDDPEPVYLEVEPDPEPTAPTKTDYDLAMERLWGR